MADFDIEAYLEEQGNIQKNTRIESSSKPARVAEVRDLDTRRDRDDRDDRGRDRDRPRDRDRYHRDDSRDRGERGHRRSRSNDRRHRDRRDDSRDRKHREKVVDREDKDSTGRDGLDSAAGGQERVTREDKGGITEESVPVNEHEKLLRDLERDRDREAAREASKRQREIDDLTKDQRTILVGQLTMKANENDLRNFFSQIGRVKNIILLRDKFTGKHKGIGYVEMENLDDIPNCLVFNNVVPDFQKFPILVKPSEAEKNFVARKEPNTVSKTIAAPKGGPDARLYMGNIHVSITDLQLRSILEQFGPVESLTLHRDEMGNSKGFAFARFADAEHAKLAMSSLGGLELAGRALKVGPVLDGSNASATVASKTDGPAGSSSNWKLDDDDGVTGMSLNSQSRVALMAKLGQAAGLSVPVTMQMPVPGQMALPVGMNMGAASLPPTLAVPPITGTPGPLIIIRNMFSLEEETEAGWDADIREDVMEECSKHGQVLQCHVDTRRTGGMVYLQFADRGGAAAAAKSLHGRFFAGRMITVSYLDAMEFAAYIA